MDAMDRINTLIGEYDFPLAALRDVNQRVTDWKASSTYKGPNDSYLWQQARYLENLVKIMPGLCKKRTKY